MAFTLILALISGFIRCALCRWGSCSGSAYVKPQLDEEARLSLRTCNGAGFADSVRNSSSARRAEGQ